MPAAFFQFPLLYRLLLLVLLTPPALNAASRTIDYNRDIRPILSDHCYACHGPDENKRKAGLRLDQRDGAFGELKSGRKAVVPGRLDQSSLIEHILSKDPDEVMPPASSKKPLSPEKIQLLKDWVKSGAAWTKHWSFIPPNRPPLPRVRDRKWPRDPIDHFILARLEKEGLKPNRDADKNVLIRRVTLDLTGLPPKIEEVDAFLADSSPNAYEKVVDRLLLSPHYGERMAQPWLDLSRYADTSGYHFDGVRFMWLWRDWVIGAFNQNQRFDQFTLEQLAGDLLPDPSQEQRVATGFVRNNMTNDEGGADPDEYLNKYVVDRVSTVGTVWLGLTVSCSECHDHKFDPITTREFYRLYSFFHNVPEKGLDRIRTDNPPPRLPVPTAAQALKFVEADFVLKDAEKTLKDKSAELGETQEKWERELDRQPLTLLGATNWFAWFQFEDSLQPQTGAGLKEVRMVGTNGLEFVEARLGKAVRIAPGTHAELDDFPLLDATNAFTVSAVVRLETNQGAIFSKMEKEPGYRGFDLMINESKFETHLVGAWPDNALKVRTKEEFAQKQWHQVVVTYDGSAKAAGLKIYVNGRARELEVQKDKLSGTVTNGEPLRIGTRREQYPLRGLVDDLRFAGRALNAEEIKLVTYESYLPVLTRSRGKRSKEERDDLARFYKEVYAADFLQAEAALAKAKKQKEDFYTSIPTTLIMEEMNPPRETHLLVRGDYRNKGEKVTPNTPAFLPPLPEGQTNRLALARWLISQEHPLTARVTVNRFWALFFGNGLVSTLNDFGAQGEWPTHPELLDWMAVQFRDGGKTEGSISTQPSPGPWDVKALVRSIVTSSTYRQSAVVTPEKLEKDAGNRLLSRAPRLRLDAEFIRDNALAAAGMLNAKLGGPSVKPYQPPGIWDGVDASYKQDQGDLLYRRGLYVFWRRSAHYPSFATFDAPNREVCTFLRQRTQTPLQSLVLMNDPVYVEAARGLAQRVMREEPVDLHRRLVRAFRHVLGRVPEANEVRLLKQTHDEQEKVFREDAKAAEDLLKVGDLKRLEQADPVELATMTAVASVLLNLNESLTK